MCIIYGASMSERTDCLLDEMEHFIRQKIEKEHWTHKQLSAFLKLRFRCTRGLSVRSLERLGVDLCVHIW